VGVSASALGLQPPVAEPKTRTRLLSRAPEKRARAEVMDEDYDERMRRAINERALQPVQAKSDVCNGYEDEEARTQGASAQRETQAAKPKAAIDFGYRDLVAAARSTAPRGPDATGIYNKPAARPPSRSAPVMPSRASELQVAQQGAGNAARAEVARTAGAGPGEQEDILPSPAALYERARLALEERPEPAESGRPGPAAAYDSIIAAANRPRAPKARGGADVIVQASVAGRSLAPGPDDRPLPDEAGRDSARAEEIVEPSPEVRQEIVAAAAEPGVKASKAGDGPIVLMPSEAPAPTPALAAPPEPQPPAPPAEPAQPETVDPRAARQALPPEAAAALAGEAEPAAGAAAPAEAVAASDNAAPRAADEVAAGAEQAAARGQAPPAGPVVGPQAGAAVVPPPAPDGLRAAIPEREPTFEEFQATFESGRTVEEDRGEVQRLLDGLRTSAEQEKAAVSSDAEAQKAQIAAETATQSAAVRAAMATQIAAIQAQYAAARANLTGHVEQQKAAVDAQVEQELARVEADTAARVVDAEAQLAQRQADLTAYAQEQSQQPPIIARQESERASAELETAAREAEAAGEAEASRYPGNEDPKPDQRAAARQVGRDSAADIRAKKPVIAEDLQSRTVDFSGRYMEYAERVNAQIQQAREALIPALHAAGAGAVTTLQQTRETTLQAMDDRLQVDLQALDGGERAAIERVQTAGDAAIAQLQDGAQQGAGEVDAAAAALLVEIDSTVEEADVAVSGAEEPFLPGITDVIEAARASLMQTGATGRARFGDAAATARHLLAEVATSFATQAAGLALAAQDSASGVQEQARAAIEQSAQSRAQQAQDILDELGQRQQGLVDDVLAEVDGAVVEARGQIAGINDQLRDALREAADESIREAIKPRTDPAEERAHEAAEKAGQAWYVGLFQALGEILVGLIILVAVALVVAAIAAAFGVILTAWTAVMIAGGILLAAGFIFALVNRAGQEELADANPLTIVGLAFIDTIGVTGIIEGITGNDIVTGEDLSDAEQTRRGVTGAFSLVMLILGARAAIKGPPGGAFTRPTGVPRGWVGWRNVIPAAWRGIKSIGGELWTGLREGVKNLREWLEQRFQRGGREGPGAGVEDPAAERAPNPDEPVRGCFIPGTMVQTSERSRPIEELAGGALVLSGDPLNGRRASRPVERVFVHGVTEVVDVRIGSTVLTCSPPHPFWVIGRGWTEAGALCPGNLLLTSEQRVVSVDSVRRRQGTFTVHNLDVRGYHTYYVSPLGLLVHNKAAERSFRARVEEAVIEEMQTRPGGETAEAWDLTNLEGPHKMANLDPNLGPNQVRYQATFLDTFTGERVHISINYDVDTGQFGIIKFASGK
jgi:Pretoxin HINT domain